MFKAALGFPCLTCGGTRAALALFAGHPLSALAWNPLVAAAILAAGIYVPYAWLVVGGVLPPVRTGWLSPPAPGALRWLAGAALLGNWVYVILMGR
ncbi:MAG: DUF2752 domain-containing protein [Acidobacteriota bacterium]